MTAADLELLRNQEARRDCERAERTGLGATLQDGLLWERLGLGRVFFVEGQATWFPVERSNNANG